MKIALISIFLPSAQKTGGVSYVAHHLANALVDRGHDVTVVSFDEAPAEARYAVRRMPVSPRWRENWLYRRLLIGYLSPLYVAREDYRDFDVIHALGDDQLLFLKGKPVLRTFLGSALGEARSALACGRPLRAVSQLALYPLELLSALLARRCVGISRGTLRTIPGVHETVPVGVDLELFHPNGRKSPEPSILFVGMLGGRKRGARLLEIFQEAIRPRLPEARLWLGVERLVEAPGVESFVSLPTPQLAERFRRAWVYCSLSRYEGFGVPYVEAMASGTAVVSSDNGGAREILAGSGGPYGTICPDSEIAPTLIGLLSDENRRRSLEAAGLKRAAEYRLQDTAARYESIYREMLA